MKKIIESVKAWFDERNNNAAEERAQTLFDVTVYNNKQWLTYSGAKVCPCDMFEEKDVATVISTIRWNYIYNHKKL